MRRSADGNKSVLVWSILFLITTQGWGFGGVAAAEKPFYEGKNLRILIPYAPGGTSDIFSRMLAKYMARFIPGNPSIIVQNMPGGGGLIGMNYLYNIAKPDGLTVGHTSVPGARDQLIANPGVKFDFTKFEYMGSGGGSHQVFAIRGGLPYKNLNELKNAEKTIFIAVGSKGSTSSVVTGILAREGFKVKGITGYRGSAPRSAAVLKGEVDATLFEAVTALRERNQITPFFWVAAKAKEWKQLPDLGQLPFSNITKSFLSAVTTPVNLARTYLLPPKTPKEQLQILQQAFERTVKMPEFTAQAEKINLPVHWRSADETKAMTVAVLDTPPEGVAALREILGMSK